VYVFQQEGHILTYPVNFTLGVFLLPRWALFDLSVPADRLCDTPADLLTFQQMCVAPVRGRKEGMGTTIRKGGQCTRQPQLPAMQQMVCLPSQMHPSPQPQFHVLGHCLEVLPPLSRCCRFLAVLVLGGSWVRRPSDHDIPT